MVSRERNRDEKKPTKLVESRAAAQGKEINILFRGKCNGNKEVVFSPPSDQLESIGRVTLAGVMCGHLRLSHLQPNVFFAPALPE